MLTASLVGSDRIAVLMQGTAALAHHMFGLHYKIGLVFSLFLFFILSISDFFFFLRFRVLLQIAVTIGSKTIVFQIIRNIHKLINLS